MSKLKRLYFLILQIFIFSILYMLLDDSHFSGINTLEEMIKTEILQKKIKPIVDLDNKNDLKENIEENKNSLIYEYFFDNSKKQTDENIIKNEVKEIKKDIEEENIVEDLTKPSLFQSFFKRMYFSFVTGTTLGYGDIYPKSVICKTFTIVQLLFSIIIIIL